MLTIRNLLVLTLALVMLVACGGQTPVPPTASPVPPGATSAPSNTPVPGATATTVPPTPGPLFAQGLSTEPLDVIATQPPTKSTEVPVTKEQVRIIVQFNHPVVPLTSIDAQKDLPQPLTLQPGVTGEGRWLNTSTYVFSPTQNLAVATAYNASLAPLKDMLGQSLSQYAWTFKTASPGIVTTYPADNTKYAGVSQPITVTFNTEMDRDTAQARFSVKSTDTNTTVTGKFEWQGVVLRFIPDRPLEYDKSYTAQLDAGAKDINKLAETNKNVTWRFTTTKAPGLASSTPRDGATNTKDIRNGLTLTFNSPMDPDQFQVTLVPTITNQSVIWDRFNVDAQNITAHVYGNWLASQAYAVTIGANSKTRFGEPLGKDTTIRFTAAPLDPAVNLNVSGMMGMFDANVPQVIFASFTNVAGVNFRLYRVDRNDLIRLNGNNRFRVWDSYAPPEANKLRDWSVPASTRLNATGLVSTTLTADGSALAPGTYFISALDSRASIGVSRYVVVVSNVNLALKRTETEALVWVTDLKTGKPVADQALTLRNQNSSVVGTGKSDKDGVWRVTFARTNSYDPLLVTSENADGVVIAAAGTEWADGIRPYDFNLLTEYQGQDYYSNLYTDRAIYRPGQSVYFKGILRRDNDASYSLPDVKNAPIIVFDSQGKQVYSQTLALSSFGTFNGAIALADSASTGSYNIQLQLGQDPHKYYANASFQVAEYKAPEFQVQVKTDRDEYFNGDKIQVNSGSTYFFGGAVADANVTWRLLSDDLFFRPDNVKGFWDFTDYDLSQRRVTGGVIREGKGKTDSSGTFKVEVPADLKDLPLSQNLTIETEVVDINNQSVSSRVTVPVHKGKFYIGLHPQKYVGTANQEQGVDIITVDSKGASVANQALALSFYQREWYSVRAKDLDGNFYWKSAFTDTLESQVNVSTNAQGQASAKFTPKKGGVYRIVAAGQDASGNAIRSATYQWVTTREFVNWRVDNNDRIDLVADKKQYNVGETAEVLIPAPFAGAEALVTIERGSIREVRRLTLQGNSESVKIPILSDYAPNVYVSVMLVKGRGADSPTPQFKIGYTNLSVATTEMQLTVKVTPDKTKYAPRDNADFTVEAVNSKGQPVAAEFSVALVDKAIQSLADETSPSPLNAFYGQRGLAVQTSATLNRSVERINQTLTPEAKGGGGGAQLQAPVRRDFRDTAFWKADLVTDGNGRARVSIPLPDNLTTWNLTAKGVTLNTQVGDARADIISTRDLLVRPVTPRFFVPGDKTRLEAVVNNNSDKDISADVKLDAQGLALAGNATQPLTIRAHDKAKVSWDTTTSAVENVVVTMSVNGGGLNDAVELTLPVKRPSSVETVGTAGQVDTTIAEKIQLPATLDKSAGNLQIQIAPSLAAAARDSLNYLEAFDYDCTEQTVSKFFPNVVTYNALKRLGVDRPELGASLRVNVDRQVQRLYALQNQDGGWGWWTGESRPMITAYALLALDGARQSGFAVDDNVMRRAEQFLTRYLDQPLDVKLGYAANERAFVLFTLTEMGRNYTSRAVNLFDQRATMALYGKAYLMMTLLKLKQPQALTLQSELASAAILDATGAHWEEKTNEYWTMNTNTRTTALVIMAFARNNAKDPTLTNAVRWLMLARQQGHWKSTQETAWAVLALTDYMVGTGELNANYSFTVNLNGKQIGDGKVDKSNVDQAKSLTVAIKDLLTAQANDLALSKNGDGKMYYSAFLNYYLPVENLPALNRGLVVGRQYEAVDPQTLKATGKLVTSAKIGDYVQVRLALIAPTDMNYLVMEDYLPAGFEAVDTTLKTSSVAAQGPVLKDQNAPKTDDIYARWFMPYWGFWAHSEIRDDRVAVFATYLGRGVYEYTYTIRASVAGEFRTLPARAWEMYFPDVFGRSAGATFVVAGN